MSRVTLLIQKSFYIKQGYIYKKELSLLRELNKVIRIKTFMYLNTWYKVRCLVSPVDIVLFDDFNSFILVRSR